MFTFPKDKLRLTLDPFWQLQYALRPWTHRNDLLVIYIALTTIKLVGFATRTLFAFHSLDNLEVFIELSAALPIPLLSVLKTLFLLYHRKRVSMLFSVVNEDFWDLSIAGPSVETHLQKRYKLINYLLLGHVSGCIFYVLIHIMFGQVPIPEGRTRWLPLLVSLGPIDQDKSPTHEILYFLLTWNMFMSIFGNAFYDLTFVYGCQHLCGQLMLLKGLLRRLDHGLMERCEDVEKFRSEGFQRDVQKRIAFCVRHHNLLLRYGYALIDYTSMIFGIQLLTTALILILMGYSISENTDRVAKSAMFLSFFVSSTIQFTIFAIQSDDVYSESISVAAAAYQCKWFLFNSKIKRSLSFVIMKSQAGIRLNAAGLIDVNNELIMNMASKVFSCITLLRSFDEA